MYWLNRWLSCPAQFHPLLVILLVAELRGPLSLGSLIAEGEPIEQVLEAERGDRGAEPVERDSGAEPVERDRGSEPGERDRGT